MRSRLAASVAAAVALSGLVVPALSARAAEPPSGRNAARERAEAWRPIQQRLQVRFKDGVGASARADALARVAARGVSARVDKRIPALNAAIVSASDPRAAARALRSDPNVAYVEPTSIYRPFYTEPRSRELNELAVGGAHDAATPNLGAGTEIAILDSPVSSTVPDLDGVGKVVSGGDFTTDYPESPGEGVVDYACDAENCPHGTGVASAAAAEADDANMVGVAPAAGIRSYTVFRRFVWTDPETFATWEDVLGDSAAIVDALAAVATYGSTHPELVAVNMSLGGPFDSKLVRDAIKLVHDSAPQVTVVVAAGNDGGERANFPAGDPYVLSVGATGQVDVDEACSAAGAGDPWNVVSFSNRGDVDVVAPGRCVDVWYPTVDETTNAVEAGTVAVRKEDGTSFAAPMVAGIAALLGTRGVKGDAARAAIIFSASRPATPLTTSPATGVGKANAAEAITTATAVAGFYTAASIDRGGQVASVVGRRTIEVIRVAPNQPSATPPVPTPTVSTGFGTVTAQTAQATSNGVSTRRFTYAAPTVNKAGQSTSLYVWDGVGGSDDIAVPMRMLDPGDNFEGLPAASGESGSAALTFGSRSAYIRSFAVPSSGARADWTYTYGQADPAMFGAQLLLWEPTSVGGVADAATEPFYGSMPQSGRSGADYFYLGGPNDWGCTYIGGDPNDPASYAPCRTGRFLIGFLAFSPLADSSASTKYALRTTWSTAPTATVTSQPLASNAGTAGPFGVAWAGTRAVKWDVAYAVKTKTSSGWVVSAWKPWKTQTTAKSATFGAGNLPEKVTQGRTYWFRVVAYDSLGNPTLPITRATAAPFDDRYSGIAYSTGATAWAAFGSSSYWLGTGKKATVAGARASMASETSAFSIVGTKCAGCGQFKVYVDGVLKKTVDTYRSTTAVRQVLWTSGTLAGGVKAHRVTIVVVGTKGRPAVVLDGISILR